MSHQSMQMVPVNSVECPESLFLVIMGTRQSAKFSSPKIPECENVCMRPSHCILRKQSKTLSFYLQRTSQAFYLCLSHSGHESPFPF